MTKIRDVNVVKYRKLLHELQCFCKDAKRKAQDECCKRNMTDFERGVIAGKSSAYNDLIKEIHHREVCADVNWQGVHCREENICDGD